MKKPFLLMLLALLSTSIWAQTELFPANKTSIATLLIDYNTYDLDSLNVSYYDCPKCYKQNFDIKTKYNSPGDFGDVAYSLKASGDTFFFAGIVWMGRGKVAIPKAFDGDSLINLTDSSLPIPKNLKTLKAYNPFGSNDSIFTRKRDRTWKEASKQQIAHDFLNAGGQAAIMLWTPTVGAFNPGVAKWVVFLYHTDRSQNLNQQAIIIELFPNPVNNELIVQTDHKVSGYRLFDLFGKTLFINDPVLQGNISTAHLWPGTYILEIVLDDGTIVRKKLLKE